MEPGDTIELTFHIHDTYDSLYDSLVILDNFSFVSATGGAVIGETTKGGTSGETEEGGEGPSEEEANPEMSRPRRKVGKNPDVMEFLEVEWWRTNAASVEAKTPVLAVMGSRIQALNSTNVASVVEMMLASVVTAFLILASSWTNAASVVEMMLASVVTGSQQRGGL